MPKPKQLKKLEKVRSKGIDVAYPHTPWFTDNVEAMKKENEERQKRMDEAENAHLLESYPAKRVFRSGKPKVERDELKWNFKFP